METTVKKNQETKTQSKIQLPFYYKEVLVLDYGKSVVYGKITSRREHTIHIIEDFDGKQTIHVREKNVNALNFKTKIQIEPEEYIEAKNAARLFLATV